MMWQNTGNCCGATKINLLAGEGLSGCENYVKKNPKYVKGSVR